MTTGTGLDRRKFLTVLGATGAGAALTGCSTDRVAKLIPYGTQTEDQVPGIPTWYASTCTECSAGCGLHVKTREGRAIKLEGNPDHPVNAGKLCHRGQAGLQGLYNPARIKGPMKKSGAGFAEITWDEGIKLLADQVKAAGGAFAVVSGGPRGTFEQLLRAFAQQAGGSVTKYEPFDHEPVRLAHQAVFGRDEVPVVDFAKANYILSFGADFLETWGSPLEQQRGFAASHGFDDAAKGMAKHVYVGPRLSLTAANADEWLSTTPGAEAAVALAVARHVAEAKGADAGIRSALATYTAEWAAKESGLTAKQVDEVAEGFAKAKAPVAVAGGIGAQYANAVELCSAVAVLNAVAGAIGTTVRFGQDAVQGDGAAAILALGAKMASGGVKVALVHEANPVYALPKSTGFAAAFAKVPFKVYTGQFMDETAAACDLLLPNHHALERWDDVEPRAGVQGLLQPVMEPVFKTRHTGDVLLAAGKAAGYALPDAADFHAHLEKTWKARLGGGDPEGAWREALAKGGRYAAAPASPALRANPAAIKYTAPAKAAEGEYVLLATPSSLLHDGRGTNKPWLLENPDPVTKMTWRPAIEVHPDTAKLFDARNGEIIRVETAAGAIEAPVVLYPGIAPGVLSMPLGWGHTAYGEFAKDRGANATDVLAVAKDAKFVAYAGQSVKVIKTRGYQKLARTEGTPRQLGRHIAEAMPAAHAAKGLSVKESYLELGGHTHDINPEWEDKAIEGWYETQKEMRVYGEGNNYAGEHPAWGMAVDLSKCTGCSSCVTACYAENNLPWVGEEQVLRGREMSWMRIERYWEGGEGGKALEARFVPVMCQHCENAPCEPVCPVYAAYHTTDGLNGQVYNRCVGTRYCSNNCPYKVRYFNWRAYNRWAWPEPMQLQLNPEVTVRGRGVMEKCTFCIQRIRQAQHDARLEDRKLKDGDVVTACAQACPADAIVFGDMNDPESRVRKIKATNARRYHILEEINVKPAVTYLAKVVNVDPAHLAEGGHA
ncbi:MAG: molybdopterin-dependent oxidoreductase [Gemmatimonadales bacterium]|nr:molybdopterin-dependent oxidoreductase [Gemmatimonadales bacterium]